MTDDPVYCFPKTNGRRSSLALEVGEEHHLGGVGDEQAVLVPQAGLR
jgi:hypothetical protein